MENDIFLGLRKLSIFDDNNISKNTLSNNNNINKKDYSKINSYLDSISDKIRVNGGIDTNELILKDSLRSESNQLFQKISNLNEGLGITKIVDEAIKKQVKYLEILKGATQQWGEATTDESKLSQKNLISNILKDFNKVASDTTYNGVHLLSKDDILDFMNTHHLQSSATTTNDTGHISLFRSDNVSKSGEVAMEFNINGKKIYLETQKLSINDYGVKNLAELINEHSDKLGNLKAYWSVKSEGTKSIDGGTLKNLSINNVSIGDISVLQNDIDNNLVNTINKYTNQTGVSASIKEENGEKTGILVLKSDGRGIEITSDTNQHNIENKKNYGRLTLIDDGSVSIDFNDNNDLLDSGDAFGFNLANVYDGILLDDKSVGSNENGETTTTTSMEYLSTMQITSSISLPHHAMDIALTSDNKTAVVAGFNKGLYVVDLQTGTIKATIDTNGKATETSDMLINNSTLYFADDNGGLAMLDLNTYNLNTINTSGKAKGVELSEDMKTAYVADFTKGVQIIDLDTNTITKNIATVGKAMDIEKINNKLYVADYNKGLTTINLATNSIEKNISLPGNATAMTTSSDNKRLYIASENGGINVVDVASNSLIANIATSGKATDLRLGKDESKLFVASSNGGVDMIDLSTNKVISNIDTDGKAQGIELSSDGTSVYVADHNGGIKQIKVANIVTTTTTTTTNPIQQKNIDKDELLYYAMESINSSISHLNKYSKLVDADKGNFESEVNVLTSQFIQSQIAQQKIEEQEKAVTFDKQKLVSNLSSFAFSKDINELKNISIKLLLQIDPSKIPEDKKDDTATSTTSIVQNSTTSQSNTNQSAYSAYSDIGLQTYKSMYDSKVQ